MSCASELAIMGFLVKVTGQRARDRALLGIHRQGRDICLQVARKKKDSKTTPDPVPTYVLDSESGPRKKNINKARSLP